MTGDRLPPNRSLTRVTNVLTKLNEEKAASLFLNNSIGETVTSVEFAKSSATVMMMNLVLSIRNGQPDIVDTSG